MENYQRIKDLREDADKTQQDIADIFAIAGDTRKLTKQVELQNKQMELLNKQIDYLLQLEERKQGINQNPSQNVRQNTPQNFDGSGFDTRQ